MNECAPRSAQRLPRSLRPDALDEHLAADVAQQDEGDPGDELFQSEREQASTMVWTQTQPVMGMTA